jgi:NitT/TauT family transport system permease protein
MATRPESTRAPARPDAAPVARRQATRRAGALRLLRLGLPPTVVFVVMVAAWELAVRVELLNKFAAPAPSVIAHDSVSLLGQRFLWSAVWLTLEETLIGFAVGVVAGFLVGMLSSLFPLFRRSVYPYALAFQIMPNIVFAPLFLIWFGFGIMSKIVMAASIAFFPLVVNTIAGVQTVDRDAQLMMRSLGVSRWQMFRHLTLPSAAPLIAAGLKLALTLALIGAIVAEFVGATQGLGVLLTLFQSNLDTPRVFSVSIFLAILGLALYGLITQVERRIIFWTDVGPDR